MKESRLHVHPHSLYKSIFVLVAVVLTLGFVYYIQEVILLFVFGAIVAYALNPIISWLHRRRVPRILSVLVVIGTLLALTVVGFSYLIPSLIEQIQGIISSIPVWMKAASVWWKDLVKHQPILASYHLDSQSVVQQATETTQPLLGMVKSIVGIVVGLMVALVIALYALVNPTPIGEAAMRIVPPGQQALVKRVASQIHIRIGGWLRGIITLSIATIVVTYIFYNFVFHVPYALTLAIMTALFEVVPIVGPIAAAAVAGAVAFFQEPILGVQVVIFYVFWRFVTDYWLAPKVMGMQVGLHPLTIIFSALAMAKIMGPLGLFLAIPIAATVKIMIEEVYLPRIHRQQIVPDEA